MVSAPPIPPVLYLFVVLSGVVRRPSHHCHLPPSFCCFCHCPYCCCLLLLLSLLSPAICCCCPPSSVIRHPSSVIHCHHHHQPPSPMPCLIVVSFFAIVVSFFVVARPSQTPSGILAVCLSSVLAGCCAASLNTAASCLSVPPLVVSMLPLVVRPDWLLHLHLCLSLCHWAGNYTNFPNPLIQSG